jgi:uncharacterized protein RhaS with RHS repeats
MRARYYDPALGRFISEDPLGPLAGTNQYLYVNGDPQDLTDPSGLDEEGSSCQKGFHEWRDPNGNPYTDDQGRVICVPDGSTTLAATTTTAERSHFTFNGILAGLDAMLVDWGTTLTSAIDSWNNRANDPGWASLAEDFEKADEINRGQIDLRAHILVRTARGMGTLIANPDECLTNVIQVPAVGAAVGAGAWTAFSGATALDVLGATAISGGATALIGGVAASYICGG